MFDLSKIDTNEEILLEMSVPCVLLIFNRVLGSVHILCNQGRGRGCLELLILDYGGGGGLDIMMT